MKLSKVENRENKLTKRIKLKKFYVDDSNQPPRKKRRRKKYVNIN